MSSAGNNMMSVEHAKSMPAFESKHVAFESKHVSSLLESHREKEYRSGRPNICSSPSGSSSTSTRTEFLPGTKDASRSFHVNRTETTTLHAAKMYLEDLNDSWHIFGDKKDTPWINTMQANLLISILIFCNSVWIGIETDLKPQDQSPFSAAVLPWSLVEWFFTLAFLLELLMRMKVERLDFFKENWNLFDLAVVASSLVDILMIAVSAGEGGASTRFMTVIRIVRLLRLVRILRLFRFFSELWLVLKGLAQAARGLIWVCVLLGLSMYVCAIFCTIILGHREYVDDDPQKEVAVARWHTVPKSMLTLFVVMTGEGWNEIMLDSMETLGWIWLFFVPYVTWSSLVIINMVVGIIVDESMKCSKEHEAEKKKVADNNMAERLARIFVILDGDRDGAISTPELRNGLKDEFVRSELKKLHITVGHDIEHLVKIWDEDESGTIDFSEFVSGAMALMHDDVSRQITFLRLDLQSYGDNLTRLAEEIKQISSQNSNKSRGSPMDVSRKNLSHNISRTSVSNIGGEVSLSLQGRQAGAAVVCDAAGTAKVACDAAGTDKVVCDAAGAAKLLSVDDFCRVFAVQSRSLLAELSSIVQKECDVIRRELASKSEHLAQNVARCADALGVSQSIEPPLEAPRLVPRPFTPLPAANHALRPTSAVAQHDADGEDVEKLLLAYSDSSIGGGEPNGIPQPGGDLLRIAAQRPSGEPQLPSPPVGGPNLSAGGEKALASTCSQDSIAV
eukprot:gnl/TRDRNA2_/TRDRNA2_155206_c0_seq2.p1 gnl/TRDRNA2_/TRDRNA2_155206_c0~~gnl/TRDRNA2_/TRDRNA2_155206_c0_seq2.p1  ORF type:complete len:734 (+),score=103.13 gnl/TRDRNA2_/TRDRNA2_155206_c0_seq2:30-2231(+)